MKSVVQRQEIPEEEEEPLQGKMIGTVQRQEIQRKKNHFRQKRENNTGMPDNLKAGVESLSGIDMSDVRVHYNSSKPAEVGALAYTQGTNIHVAPGQERHLPHEAWHVVQQAQGRVRPTMQMKDVAVNDDKGLEQEADEMGAKATASATQFRGLSGEQERLQEKSTLAENKRSEQKVIQVKNPLPSVLKASPACVFCYRPSAQFSGQDTVQFGRDNPGKQENSVKDKGEDYVNNIGHLIEEIARIFTNGDFNGFQDKVSLN